MLIDKLAILLFLLYIPPSFLPLAHLRHKDGLKLIINLLLL
jgi:hypothetical protein